MFAIYSSEEEDGQNDYGFKFPWKKTYYIKLCKWSIARKNENQISHRFLLRAAISPALQSL